MKETLEELFGSEKSRTTILIAIIVVMALLGMCACCGMFN